MSKALVIKGADFSANKLATVTFDGVHTDSISVSPTTVAATAIGATYQLTATLVPSDSTDAIQWLTSDTNVATITDGLVTIVGCGTCNIIASSGGKSAMCAVTVEVELAGFVRSVQTYMRPGNGTNRITATDTGVGTNSFKGCMSLIALDPSETHLTLDYQNCTGTGSGATLKPVAERTNWGYTRIGFITPVKLPQNCTKIRVLALNNNYINYPLFYKYNVGDPAACGGYTALRMVTGWFYGSSYDSNALYNNTNIPWESGTVEYDIPNGYDSITITWSIGNANVTPNFYDMTEEQRAAFRVVCC